MASTGGEILSIYANAIKLNNSIQPVKRKENRVYCGKDETAKFLI